MEFKKYLCERLAPEFGLVFNYAVIYSYTVLIILFVSALVSRSASKHEGETTVPEKMKNTKGPI